MDNFKYPPGMAEVVQIIEYQAIRHGLTHKEIAREVGCSAASIAKWRHGKAMPTPHHWFKLLELEK